MYKITIERPGEYDMPTQIEFAATEAEAEKYATNLRSYGLRVAIATATDSEAWNHNVYIHCPHGY